MFDDPTGWSWLLQGTAVISAATALLVVGRRLRLALSAPARDKRRQLSQLHRLAESASLTVDDAHQRLVGRTAGWATEVKRSREPLRSGAVPSVVWRVELVVDAPPVATLRPLPSPPPGLPAAYIEGELLVAHLHTTASPEVFAHLLRWLGEVAGGLHSTPSTKPQSGVLSEVSQSCDQLGLTADPVLPRWEGHWRGRRLLVEALSHTPLVQVHLALHVQLPGCLWIGGRDAAAATASSGAPVPLPLTPDSGRLVASAHTAHLNTCQELLADPALIAVLAGHLGDARGSRMGDGEAIVVRPATVWALAPDRVLEAALDVAEAMERAVERPWRAMCAVLPLAPTEERRGGLPVLKGTADGFALTLAQAPSGNGVHLSARAPRGMLVAGLSIAARAPSEPAGIRTGNPILDAHICITVPSASGLAPEVLAQLPADALLPIMLGGSSARVDTDGVDMHLPSNPAVPDIIEAVEDMLRLLPLLPRTRAADGPRS